MDKLTGTVAWFNDKLGYGFVTPDESNGKAAKDVFVHFSGVDMDGFRTLSAGERVSFVIASGDKGPQAEQVVRI